MLEYEMMEISYAYLSNKKNYKIVKKEVPFLSRCIDIVFVNEKDEVVSIELKVHDWRHAIEQAINHQLGADKSYICLPKRKMNEQLSSALKTTGVGLLFFEKNNVEPVYEVFAASQSKKSVPAFRYMLIENMNRV